MLFNSLQFFIFLLVLLPIFFNTSLKNQKLILFIFSLYFYSCLKIVFVPLLFLSFIITHITSKKIYNSNLLIQKKIYLSISLLTNLGLLAFFKYFDFFRNVEIDFINILFQENLVYEEPWGLILPLGISFYTFQALAYTIDIYRGKLKPEDSFFDFSLFLLFFPQLVAGPIMRASELIYQFQSKKYWSKENFLLGFEIISIGYLKKTIIADPIASVIQPIYENPSEYNWVSLAFSLYLFTIQIYCDFSGYSDIAIGTGKILGFSIPKNFERPFLSSSVTETWRRWHISLSSWLRDYVYISLGGNRVSTFRNYFNLFATTVVGGFWHGANWTFIIWGGINGVFTVIERIAVERGTIKYFLNIPKPFKIIYSFLIFMSGAHFFRSDTVEKTLYSYSRMFSLEDGIFENELFSLKIIVPVLILILIEVAQELNYSEKIVNHPLFIRLKMPLQITTILLCFFIYTVVSSPQFYYFQF
jgi:alginate O-acetyltransferase complex protein AlgI